MTCHGVLLQHYGSKWYRDLNLIEQAVGRIMGILLGPITEQLTDA